jgi:hypothetical protein
MAKRRMFSQQITESDSFLDMPLSAQALYFHLGMSADDDGFVNSPRRIQRVIGANDDDLKLLIAKKFVISFESGVVVIKHWKINNYIRSDRYTETAYLEEKALLYEKKNGAYSLTDTIGIPSGRQVGYAGKVSIGKYSKDNSSSGGGTVNVLEELTSEETEKLFDTYEDADYLIDAVEDEINLKLKGNEIHDFYRYIIGFATNTGWEMK